MLPHAASSTPPPSGHILDQHHREIEEACLALLGACYASDPGDLARRWSEIEYQLYDHMMAEEHFLFPAFQRDQPGSAQDLRNQHARLREQALEIGVAVQLHTVRMEQLQAFVAALREHGELEEASLYRWADRHQADDERHRMHDYLAAS
ncbi:MAG TPA: hemerythrin domain-containing protein [Kofleriaceae bacterium]|jgi:iron-sulfur cluster repair protein YtfE (RIC family)|nr:hemerythrin domain-containing protein [Kofleriaceae bacterium]